MWGAGSMITGTLAQEQLQRLINTPNFPAGQRGQKELLKALMTSLTDEILISAVDLLWETCECQVTVAGIRAVVSERNALYSERQRHLRESCQTCHGTGFKIVTGRYRFGVEADAAPHFIETTGARPCACRGGLNAAL